MTTLTDDAPRHSLAGIGDAPPPGPEDPDNTAQQSSLKGEGTTALGEMIRAWRRPSGAVSKSAISREDAARRCDCVDLDVRTVREIVPPPTGLGAARVCG
ncbi:MAG: hypothetical protein OXQ29_02960 [Rhodospirillaceae bacterium]|nr:hypothetical protein [Rhodospirillaceae bacterium]